MNTLVVLAHPSPESFNAAVLAAVKAGLEDRGVAYRVKDLWAEGFQPIMDREELARISHPVVTGVADEILQEQADVAWARALVFVYPVWWFDCPAILRGWVERVLIQGFSHQITEAGVQGLLDLEKVLIFQTTGAPRESVERDGLLERVAHPMLEQALRLLGARSVETETLWAVPLVSAEVRSRMLERVRERVLAF